MKGHGEVGGHQAVRLAAPRDRASWHVRTNLPAPLTSFVGREQEIDAIVARLGAVRLLTLTAIGGIGKSRLALEVGRRVLERADGEVRLVELAATSDPGLVASVVASTLGVRDDGARSSLDALAVGLADRDVLLILDNAEQLSAAIGALARRLLQDCPGLRVLATSRVPLGVHGESVWRVGPLPVPDLDDVPTHRLLARNPAVRLFVERAASVRATFALTEQNADDVARVCARLDGIPLAIELAAARVAVLSPKGIAEHLDDRFRLLASGGHDAPSHQRTLGAALDWSYAMLSDADQVLFRRLGPFAGGFTLGTVEGMSVEGAGDGGRGTGEPSSPTAPQPSPLDALSSLVNTSLVIAEEWGGEVRYRQLETVRQYGWDRLREAGELVQARRWHRDWFLAMAEANERRSWGAAQVAAFDWFELELDNLRAAIDWCEIEGTGDLGLRLGAALWRYWDVRGRIVEGRDRLSRLLDLGGPAADARARGRVCWELGMLAFWAGDVEEAVPAWQESARLGRAAGDPLLVAYASCHLAAAGQLGGRGPEADAMLADLLADPEIAEHSSARLVTLYERGYLAIQRGEHALGEAVLAEGVALGRAAGDLYTLAHCLSTLGHAALLRGDLDRARDRFVEALRLRWVLKSTATIAFTVEKLGWLAARAGEARHAGRLLGAAAAMRARAGTELYPYEVDGHAEAEQAARAALGDARFEAAFAEGRALSTERAVELALRWGAPPASSDRATNDASGRLSTRGWQIARLVARGLTNRQIAEALVLQESTVGNHLQRIYTRLALNGRAQLAAWVSQHEAEADPRS